MSDNLKERLFKSLTDCSKAHLYDWYFTDCRQHGHRQAEHVVKLMTLIQICTRLAPTKSDVFKIICTAARASSRGQVEGRDLKSLTHGLMIMYVDLPRWPALFSTGQPQTFPQCWKKPLVTAPTGYNCALKSCDVFQASNRKSMLEQILVTHFPFSCAVCREQLSSSDR